MIFLETSSYLPLIWTTPYSQSVVSLMEEHRGEGEFVLQRDCVAEAAGYFSFKDDWKYHPGVRIRRLLERLEDKDLARLGYPSCAVQLLLGGNIWPQAQYLNYVRHSTFLLADLLDGLAWEDPRLTLGRLADRIDERLRAFREMFERHAGASVLELPSKDILPYWGRWYLPQKTRMFSVRMVDDPRPYNMTADKLRDIYHYECATNHAPPAGLMIVANTGFMKNVKTSFSELRTPIECAHTMSAEFFS